MQRSFQKNVKKCKERSINFKRTLKNAAFFLKEHKNLGFFEKNACPTLNFLLKKGVIFISLGALVCTVQANLRANQCQLTSVLLRHGTYINI